MDQAARDAAALSVHEQMARRQLSLADVLHSSGVDNRTLQALLEGTRWQAGEDHGQAREVHGMAARGHRAGPNRRTGGRHGDNGTGAAPHGCEADRLTGAATWCASFRGLVAEDVDARGRESAPFSEDRKMASARPLDPEEFNLADRRPGAKITQQQLRHKQDQDAGGWAARQSLTGLVSQRLTQGRKTA